MFYLNYGDTVYIHSFSKQLLNRIQRIQNSCLRFSYDVRKFDHIIPFFFTICWLHVHQCFILHLYCPGFNILHSETPYLRNLLYLNFEFHSDATHFQDLLSIPLHYFLKFRAAFSYTVAKYFNSFITFHHPFLFIIFFFSICCSSSYLISFLIILRFLWFSG